MLTLWVEALAATGRYSISISSKQGCLPPLLWEAGSSERPLARDQHPDVRVRTRRLMSSHQSRKARRIKRHRTWTRDEKVRSFHTPTLAGEDAVLANVAATLPLSG